MGRSTFCPEVLEIRTQAMNEYQNFMALKATARDIIAVIMAEKLTSGVDWTGSTKSDLARAYVLRYYGFQEYALSNLRMKFNPVKK